MLLIVGVSCLIFTFGTVYSFGEADPSRLNQQLEKVQVILESFTREEPSITTRNRTHCPETPILRPENRVYTGDRVKVLRDILKNRSFTGGPMLDAYIITNHDEHMSPSLNERDERIKYISGMSGTNGAAVITENYAALWTDGRYFLQAEQEMDCNWILMRMGEAGYPSLAEWLVDILPAGGIVGAYPPQLRIKEWQSYEKTLARSNITLSPVPADLMDYVWTQNRPAYSSSPIFVHELQFAGKDWPSKVRLIRVQMTMVWANILVVTALDEIAWLLNLRGNDRPISPLFDAYVIISMDEVRLYLKNHTSILAIQSISSHLNTTPEGTCSDIHHPCVIVSSISDVFKDIQKMSRGTHGYNKVWLSPDSNYAVYNVAGENKLIKVSPIQLMKSVKNHVERKRYAECQLRDSAAVVEFASFIEDEIKFGIKKWTEISAAEKLNQIRSTYEHFWGKSFGAVSASGPHSAVIHYGPTKTTDAQLSTDQVYLLDSGGQYLDGTTDVTRTFLFGKPSNLIKEAYTRVLMGAIDLATSVWPDGRHGDALDIRTRNYLWQNGWDYKHGTGHGIGYFLNVHEGPASIGKRGGFEPLTEGMFLSDEPGFYVNGEFGVRLETILEVRRANTPHKSGVKYLTFHPVTLVPFENHLIDYQLLQPSHRQWLNTYHNRCEHEVGSILLRDGKLKAYKWLISRTRPIPETPIYEHSTAEAISISSKCNIRTIVTLFVIMNLFISNLLC